MKGLKYTELEQNYMHEDQVKIKEPHFDVDSGISPRIIHDVYREVSKFDTAQKNRFKFFVSAFMIENDPKRNMFDLLANKAPRITNVN